MKAELILGLGLIVACSHCSHPADTSKPKRAAAASGSVHLTGASRAYLRVEPAAAPPPVASRSLMARVAFDERKTAAIGAPVSGRVTAVEVQTGAVVKAGAALCTIHSTDIAAARGGLAEARQARMLAEQSASRAGLLARQGAGSEAEQQQAEGALEEAKSAEQQAMETLGALGAKAGEVDYTLRSPIAGTVVERSVQVGNSVSADQGVPLLVIANLSSVWVMVDVYEHDLAYVHEGNVAHVVVPALDDRRYEGQVGYVGRVIDATTRAARARIELKNDDGALSPGMFAEVEIVSPESAKAFIPMSAVLARRDEFFVFVQAGPDTFHQQAIKLGVQQGDHVASLEGLAPGTPVVTRGAILLDAEANAAF